MARLRRKKASNRPASRGDATVSSRIGLGRRQGRKRGGLAATFEPEPYEFKLGAV